MNAQQNEFLKTVVPFAQASQRHWGVPASITIAQAILESSNKLGWGQSQLARECNNFFGIKAAHHADPGTYEAFQTAEYENGKLVMVPADFVHYASIGDSFDAHAKLLATAPRYRPAMAAKADPVKFAEELQACGYSTNPNYARGLMAFLQIYDLEQYDAPKGATA